MGFRPLWRAITRRGGHPPYGSAGTKKGSRLNGGSPSSYSMKYALYAFSDGGVALRQSSKFSATVCAAFSQKLAVLERFTKLNSVS